MAKTQESTSSQDGDLLAAVLLHTLVSKGREGMAVSQVAVACERDPSKPADRREIEAALRILIADGLAWREGECFHPTRAAVRAHELSF